MRKTPYGIVTKKSILEDFLSKVNKTDEHWLWTGNIHHTGYGRFNRNLDGISDWRAHRASYRLFVGPLEQGLLVCHTCDIKHCVKPDHLFLGTALENTLDAVKKGIQRGAKGETNGSAVLNPDEVKFIRELYKEGKLSCKAIGDMYGVKGGTVYNIIKGKSWNHI